MVTFPQLMPNRRNTSTWLLKSIASFFFAGLCVIGLSGSAQAQQARQFDNPERRIVNRIEPEYPETLKRLFIGGIVRIQVTVSPNGRVERTELLGGSPILGQSAIKAVKQWKYAPAAGTDKLVVQLEFDPHR
jgi:TonB family protein